MCMSRNHPTMLTVALVLTLAERRDRFTIVSVLELLTRLPVELKNHARAAADAKTGRSYRLALSDLARSRASDDEKGRDARPRRPTLVGAKGLSASRGRAPTITVRRRQVKTRGMSRQLGRAFCNALQSATINLV
jgi:hypothetical protein